MRKRQGNNRRIRTLLLLGVIMTVARAEQGPRRGSAIAATKTTPTTTSTASRDKAKDSSVLVVSDVLQIAETEIWDGSKWKSGESRWTKPVSSTRDEDDGNKKKRKRTTIASAVQSGQPCASPNKQRPPDGFQFDGEWKIVTGGSGRDSYGWEYTVAQPFPIRQRLWLRNLVQIRRQEETTKPKTEIIKIRKRKDATKAVPKKTKRRQKPWWIRAVSDDFNFKGFGLSLYKSLVFPQSFGLAFRLPLTYNFGRWETNPGLPSLSSAIGLYFPGTAMISISTSVRLEWLKWMSARIVEISCYLLLAFVWTFLRGIVLACSALVFPITRRLYQPPIPMASPWARPSEPNYSRTIEERLGCSVSWRVSRSRGYEFRVSYWHYYVHTLTSLWPIVRSLTSLLPAQDKAAMPEWWARRSAAFGLSTAGPIPDVPHVTSSLAMSLSGYYFRPAQKVRLVASTSSKDFITPPQLKQSERIQETRAKLLPPMTEHPFSRATEEDSSDQENESNEEGEANARLVKKA